ITALQHGVEVAIAGVDIGDNDGPQLRGELGLLGTADCVAVLASGVSERMRPTAVRERLEPSLSHASALSGGLVGGLVIAQVLDFYEELLEEVEDEAVRIAEDVFVFLGAAILFQPRPGRLKSLDRAAGRRDAQAVRVRAADRDSDDRVLALRHELRSRAADRQVLGLRGDAGPDRRPLRVHVVASAQGRVDLSREPELSARPPPR